MKVNAKTAQNDRIFVPSEVFCFDMPLGFAENAPKVDGRHLKGAEAPNE
jgi:hypothetical protein